VTLIGIFGSGSGRHALLKMPNGRVQRVAAGDSVAGLQVAAIGADSVQVNSRGRASVLTLPD
jgi:type IV pilus biogenesis protein PilP